MTTSMPNITPPAGGGDPDPEATDKTETTSLLEGSLEGAEPSAEDPETDLAGSQETDSVDEDRDNSGA